MRFQPELSIGAFQFPDLQKDIPGEIWEQVQKVSADYQEVLQPPEEILTLAFQSSAWRDQSKSERSLRAQFLLT